MSVLLPYFHTKATMKQIEPTLHSGFLPEAQWNSPWTDFDFTGRLKNHYNENCVLGVFTIFLWHFSPDEGNI